MKDYNEKRYMERLIIKMLHDPFGKREVIKAMRKIWKENRENEDVCDTRIA